MSDHYATPMPSAENECELCVPAAAAPWAQRHLRLLGLLVALPAAAMLVLAVCMHPDARGYDTHTQLGLPPCGFMTRAMIVPRNRAASAPSTTR